MAKGQLARQIWGGLALAALLAGCQPKPDYTPQIRAATAVGREARLLLEIWRIYLDSEANGMVVSVVGGDGHGTVAGLGHVGAGVGPAPDGRTLVRLQSISKLFDCDLLSALVVDGRVRLADPLQLHAPPARRVPPPDQGAPQITLLNLATHTSGLPREGIRPARSAAAAQTARWIWLAARVRLPPAGQDAVYSNIGFDLLGDALSTAAQAPYQAALAAVVTGPLGMSDTTAQPTPEQCARMLSPDPARQPFPCRDQSWEAASGGLYSTADDMTLWLKAQLAPGAEGDRRRISQAVYIQRATLAKASGLDHAGPAQAIGLAWIELAASADHPRVLEKTGGGDGFLTYIVIDPAAHVGVFVAFDNLSDRRLPVVAADANALIAVLDAMAAPTCDLATAFAMTAAAAALHPDGLPSPRRWWAAIALWLGITMTVLDSSIANVALPTIAHDFGAAPSKSIWIVNAYQLAIVTTLLPLASLGEIIGYRLVYRAGIVLFTIASLGCAMSHSMGMLTVARAVQGLGAAAVMSINGALVRHIYPHAQLGHGIGLNAMVVSASSAIGPTVAAGILAFGPWQWLFGVNIPVGLASMAIGWASLPEDVPSQRRFDWLSAALNALTFGLVISGVDVLTRTKARIAGAAETIAGLVFATLLVLRELARPRPLVPFDLLRNPIFALSVATSIASFSAQMLAFVALPFHFENALHFNQVETGLLLTPWPAAVALMAPVAGWLADRFSTPILCAAGLAVFCAGLSALALAPSAAGAFDIGWRMALCGTGFGLFQSPNNRMMLTNAPRERAGAAGGMLGTARLTGQTCGAVLTAIFLHQFHEAGEVIGLWVAAGFAAVAAAVSLSRTAVRGPEAAMAGAPPS